MSINRFSEKIVMPVCLITVKSDSFINSMTVAWSTPLSANPPLFGFAIKKQRYTYPMLMKEKEFTVTFLPYEKSELSVKLGRISAREGDKLLAAGVKLKGSEFVKAPYIEDGYFSMECTLENSFTTGDHEFVVGKVVAIHENEGSLENLKPLMYLSKDTFSTIDEGKIKKIDTKKVIEEIRKKLKRGVQGD
ncbi:MAG: Flavin reductase domain protein FMN-binding [Petrotoga mobilis]|nr:MAG: Flavin reductase domain protein FMN-binding [Petrotoga mobilis]KUK80555.1 MAG: Flavin reductase domain protein FMN-binding [Petrotoga mobilis]HBT51810.1 hypothetical protein [Petrotoga sp.]